MRVAPAKSADSPDFSPAFCCGLDEARAMFCRHRTYRLTVRRGEREPETVLETLSLFDG